MRVSLLLVGLVVAGPALATAIAWTPHAPPDAPPIRFAPGSDHAAAQAAGLVGEFDAAPDGSHYRIHLQLPSGSHVAIDDLVHVHKDAAVSTYRLEVAHALTGDLAPRLQLHVRLWHGPVPPASDADPQVCAALDLTRTAGTLSEGACRLPHARMQVTARLDPQEQAHGAAHAALRPAALSPA